MLGTISKILDLLDRRGRQQALLLLAMILVTAAIETAGVASIVPFVAVLADPNLVTTNSYLNAAYHGLGFTSIHSFFIFLGLVVFVVTVGSTALKAASSWALLRFTGMRYHALSCQLFQGYLYQPYAWFLRRHSTDLAKTMLSEVGEVINGALIPGMQLIAHGTVAILLISLLLVADPVMAIAVSSILASAYWLIFWTSRKYVKRIGKDRVLANRERFRLSNESLSGIKDVKVAGLEDVFLRRFEKTSLRFVRHQAAAQLISQLPQYALQAIAFGGILLIVQYQLILHDSLSRALPLIALYALAGYRLLPALQQVYQQMSKLRFAMPALDVLHRDLVENAMGRGSRLQTDASPQLLEQVELRDVVYLYPGSSAAALDHVNILIRARTTVGLVGQTGSGKTTAVDVILGLLEPSAGSVLIDGVKISTETQRNWRRCAGYVPQHIFLADDTVAANIAFGVEPNKIDMAAVKRAGKIAKLHDFVSNELELGYQTPIGERGIRLSGGQRQRVGVARALYHNPDILIMDEATSALDNVTERAVMDAVENLEHQKTIILIAHRLSTVRRCETIFLLERGRVVASGTYDQLLQRSEHFQSLVASGL